MPSKKAPLVLALLFGSVLVPRTAYAEAPLPPPPPPPPGAAAADDDDDEPLPEPPPAAVMPPGARPEPRSSAFPRLVADTAPIPKAVKPTRWYGWQLLITDGAAVLTVLADQPAVGSLAYVLGGPIVHGVHQRPKQCFASVGMRLVLPLASYLLVNSARTCDPIANPGACDSSTTYKLGVLTGALLASTVDIAFLSTETRPKKAPGATLAITPSVVVDRRGGGVVVGGAF